jgi:hypothetical protein
MPSSRPGRDGAAKSVDFHRETAMSGNDRDRPDQTLTDYVGIALAPALIMALVGTLVFFLLEVCYSGEYVARMRWTFFFYVFGIVLVCRISMLPDIADRSWLYGIFLAGATWVCLQVFVEYPEDSVIRLLAPVINLAIIAIVWWSSSKLVWDSTNIDEETDMSGEGLLQASGLDGTNENGTDKETPPGAETTSATGIVAWWERCQRYRRTREKKRTLGVWVVYFSLAALPLFGLGQSVIPASETARRLTSYWLLVGYVASGLGLLLTTCFLGLRRYLRQRRLKMPAAMTGVWLISGVVLITLLLCVAAVIPRPQAEFALFDWKSLTGGERSASDYAAKGDSPGKGEGRSGNPTDKKDAKSEAGGSKGEKAKKEGEGGGDKSGQEKGTKGEGSKGDEGQKGSSEEKGKGGEGKKEGNDRDSKKDSRPTRDSQKDGRKQKDSSGSQGKASSPASVFEPVAKILKWVVFAIVAVITVGAILFGVVRFLANFTGWADRFLKAWYRFWGGLFGRRRGRRVLAESAVSAAAPARPPRPFSSYHNPFRLGQPWTPLELCCYTFSAFEARARELGVARQPGETPLEHAERVGEEYPALEEDARRLALIYARGVYGADSLPTAVNDVLSQVWDTMEAGDAPRVAV